MSTSNLNYILLNSQGALCVLSQHLLQRCVMMCRFLWLPPSHLPGTSEFQLDRKAIGIINFSSSST
jgi:hypothetical protein